MRKKTLSIIQAKKVQTFATAHQVTIHTNCKILVGNIDCEQYFKSYGLADLGPEYIYFNCPSSSPERLLFIEICHHLPLLPKPPPTSHEVLPSSKRGERLCHTGLQEFQSIWPFEVPHFWKLNAVYWSGGINEENHIMQFNLCRCDCAFPWKSTATE